MPTLYQANLNLEQVQAMVLVSGWSDNGWLSGGHAVRMALQLCKSNRSVKVIEWRADG